MQAHLVHAGWCHKILTRMSRGVIFCLFSSLISNITCKLPNHILLRSSRQCGETIQHSVPQQTILCAKSPPSETSLSSSLENSIALERVDCHFPSDTFFTCITIALKHPPSPQGHFCGSIFTGSTQCLPPVRLSLLSFHCRQLYCDRSCSKCRGDFSGLPRGEFFTWKLGI